jgi:hypothetical protein
MRRLIFSFLLVLIGSGCGSSVSGSGNGGAGGNGGGQGGGGNTSTSSGSQGGGGGSAVACQSDADCDQQICVYAIGEACKAHGTCQTKPKPLPCNSIEIFKGCGCDGQEADWTGGCAPDAPAGYAPKPIAHVGACGTKAQCSQDTDCVPANGYTPPDGFTHGECAYLQADGCAARGQCEDPFPMCDDLIVVPGCACDGTTVKMGCGYPSKEFAPKPLAHLGACP